MTLEEAIELITGYYESECGISYSPILAVLETREELADDAGSMNLGDDEMDAAFEMVLAADREDLVIALEGVLDDA